MSPQERDRLLKQFEDLQKNIEEQQRRQISEQDSQLEEALRNRRSRKQLLVKQIAEQQSEQIIKSTEKNADQLLQANFGGLGDNGVDKQQVKAAFDHLNGKFNNDEMV